MPKSKEKVKRIESRPTQYPYQLATTAPSELRQDLVSGDWVVVATGRAKRPDLFKSQKRKIVKLAKNKCPFEDLRKAGNAEPLLIYRKPNARDWFVQVVPNKYPAFMYGACPVLEKVGPYQRLDGVGFHEIFVTRDHERQMAQFNDAEVELVLRAYQERYQAIKNDPCIQYIFIFHNHGAEAGASVPHPHSQMVGVPIVPADVQHSLDGSKKYWQKHKRCVHCGMIKWELKKKDRIVFKSDGFVAVCPFASRRAFEIRIFPLEHHAHFDHISDKQRLQFAKVLRQSLHRLYKGLNDPAYNFFIHTAPTVAHKEHAADHYHWHLEILPITSVWGGVEFGTGIEVSTVTPEAAAEYLRTISVKRKA